MNEIKKRGLVNFAKDLLEKINRDEAMPYAYQLTYSLLLAIFPFIIFLFSLVGFMNLDQQAILSQMEKFLPTSAFELLSGVITEVTTKQSGALLSISILTAIWSAAGGFKAFMQAMNNVMNLQEDRSFLKINLNAVINVILLAVGIVGSLIMMIFAQPIISTIERLVPQVQIAGKGLDIIAMIIPMVFLFILFLLFYIFIPARNVKVKYALPGAIFSTIAFLLVSLGFKFYVNTINDYNKFYGSLGTVVVLMFWFLLLSMIMVIGGEVNSLLIRYKRERNPYWENSKPNAKELSPEAVGKVNRRYAHRDSRMDPDEVE